jgi:enoyl-CoA hydratase/carnithine racemase
MAPILFERDEAQIGTIIINRPESKNALNWEAMTLLSETMHKFASEDDLRALIITGSGDTFCAGGDVYELHNHLSRGDGELLSSLTGTALSRLASLPVPTIAAIEGVALGGGAELALACDFRIFAVDAELAFPQIRLGLCTAWGGTRRLVELAGYSRALEGLMTGKAFTAQHAIAAGLANLVVDRGKTLQAARELAKEFGTFDPAAVRAVKSVALSAVRDSREVCLSLEQELFTALWASEGHREASAKIASGKLGRNQSRD